MWDFPHRLGKARKNLVFREEGWHVWCPSVVAHGGQYFLLYSRWPLATGHDGWVTHSEVAWAVGPSPGGPFVPGGVALAGAGGQAWDADVVHNPTVLAHNGRFYLYYMGNFGDGTYWDHRNHQRIGLAVADHPAGPWTRLAQPVLDVTPGSWDELMVSNPTVCVAPTGEVVMVYKGVGTTAAPLPKGGPVVLGVAKAPGPDGPFTKTGAPILTNPHHPWALEDPFLWHDGRLFHLLAKDFQGHFTGRGPSTVAHFESSDAVDWRFSPHPFAFDRQVEWDDGRRESFEALERPFLADGPAGTLLWCAAASGSDRSRSCLVPRPLAVCPRWSFPRKVVLYGTSLTREGAWAEALTDWFETASSGRTTVVNAAECGRDSSWALAHLQTRVLSELPDLVFLEFAINDANERDGEVGLEASAVNLRTLVRALRIENSRIHIVVQIMNPVWEHPQNHNQTKRPQLKAYLDQVRALATELHLPLIDHEPAWNRVKDLGPDALRAAIPDGTHPTREASLAITWPLVRSFLEDTFETHFFPRSPS